MSLSTLLTGKKQAIDTELDALFTAKPTASTPFKQASTPISIPGSSKDGMKKRKHVSRNVADEEPSKRLKTSPSKPGHISDTKAHSIPKPEKAGKKKHGTKGKSKEPTSDSEDENSDLENAYHATKHSGEKQASIHDDDGDEGDVIGGIEDGDQAVVHESSKKGGKRVKSSATKIKFVPSDETPELRNQRTIFVGNLSVDIAQQRPLLKQLQRHILSQIPTAKIESTRFRSVAFQAPTAKLPDDDALEGKANPKASAKPSTSKSARPHDIDRTTSWRSLKDEDDAPTDEKKYLNTNQKKKIAFINQEFHSTADSVNAYIVFAHPAPTENRPANLPPPPVVMDPYEAARLAVRACDGSSFMGRAIRVDLVGKKSLHTVVVLKTKDGVDDNDAALNLPELVETDPKSSVFVGNLDFASKEEDLRVFFNGVVSGERGPPPSDDEENSNKSRTWVTRVRIVRDRDTQLGKGFAYVQFADHQCVDEVLALEPTKLKFAKRKLRVQRCRTLPGSSTSTRQATAVKSKEQDNAAKAARTPVPIVVPKGDPALGDKLAHLSKEARKEYKSSDADRVARRLAKKKARNVMASTGGVKLQGNDRERVRKGSSTGIAGKVKNAGSKKGRVRSEKSLAKRNGKKAGGKQ